MSSLHITALGRQEEWEDSPEGYPQTPPCTWWTWHDEYGNTSSSQWSSIVDRFSPADLEYPTSRAGHQPLSIRIEALSTHREVNRMGEDPFFVEFHRTGAPTYRLST